MGNVNNSNLNVGTDTCPFRNILLTPINYFNFYINIKRSGWESAPYIRIKIITFNR